jgi:polysaccharide pyruvyl transferase WcaK-like protein
MAKQSKKTILLLGTHGQYNWGDDILLHSFLHQLGPNFSYYINSYDPESTRTLYEQEFDIKKVFHTTKDTFSLPKIIFSSDIVFFAGGTIIRELYKSSKRNKYASMAMVLGVVAFSKIIARKKVVMSNIGAGPIPSTFGRLLTRILLSLVDFASFRDQQSLDLVRHCGVRNKNMRVVPDCVFVNSPRDFHNSLNQNDTPTSPLTIALNINYDIANTENWEYFIATLGSSLRSLAQTNKIRIIGLPMQTAFNPKNDLIMLEQFRSRIPNIHFEIQTPRKTSDIGDIINRSDIVMAERLHALVIAAILGKPFIALQYDVKVRSLVDILGVSDYAVDINTHFPETDIIQKTTHLIENRQKISLQLATQSQILHNEVAEYFNTIRAMLT